MWRMMRNALGVAGLVRSYPGFASPCSANHWALLQNAVGVERSGTAKIRVSSVFIRGLIPRDMRCSVVHLRRSRVGVHATRDEREERSVASPRTPIQGLHSGVGAFGVLT